MHCDKVRGGGAGELGQWKGGGAGGLHFDEVCGGGAGELGQWKGGGAGGVHCDQVRGGGAGDLKLFGIYALNLLTSELSWG